MKKIGYITVIVLLLFLTFFILTDSVLYEPVLNRYQTALERKWGCKIVRKGADFDLMKGSLWVKDISMGTNRAVSAKWNLRAKEIFIHIDYFSLVRRNIILKKLILNKVSFKQEYIEALDVEKKDMSQGRAEKRTKKEQTQRKKGRSEKAILVRNFLIKDGSFEFNYLQNSGKKGRFKAEQVNLNKKNIFLDSKPNEFFRSLFGGIKGF